LTCDRLERRRQRPTRGDELMTCSVSPAQGDPDLWLEAGERMKL